MKNINTVQLTLIRFWIGNFDGVLREIFFHRIQKVIRNLSIIYDAAF